MKTDRVLGQPINRLPIKYRWSHRLAIHRVLVKTFNFLIKHIPFRVKYGVATNIKRNRLPYSLVDSGEVKNVLQVGAPNDTLSSGRSRGMLFALLNRSGTTVIVEPDPESETAFNEIKSERNLDGLVFHKGGAWNEKTNLKLYIDPSHPATNFTEGTVDDYDEHRMKDFDTIEIACNTVDNILAEHNIDSVDLVSMTTNGAEMEILAGMEHTFEKGIKYICIARHLHIEGYMELLNSKGFELLAHDDRGYTFSCRTIRG